MNGNLKLRKQWSSSSGQYVNLTMRPLERGATGGEWTSVKTNSFAQTDEPRHKTAQISSPAFLRPEQAASAPHRIIAYLTLMKPTVPLLAREIDVNPICTSNTCDGRMHVKVTCVLCGHAHVLSPVFPVRLMIISLRTYGRRSERQASTGLGRPILIYCTCKPQVYYVLRNLPCLLRLAMRGPGLVISEAAQ